MPSATRALDPVFHALAHPARRAVIERLARGPAGVSELAAPFDMALPSFLEHIHLLEKSGLVKTRKRGRVRTVEVVPLRLAHASRWLEAQRSLWSQRLDQLDDYVKNMEPDKR